MYLWKRKNQLNFGTHPLLDFIVDKEVPLNFGSQPNLECI